MKAGASGAITQFFFNPDAYFHFVDEVRALGARHADRAGHHAVQQFAGLLRFADNCGTEIPRWVA